MEIELRKIDATNRNAVVLLAVSDRQKQYIASNEKSLKTAAEEKYKNISRPFAIYADDNLVGFTMFAFDFEDSGMYYGETSDHTCPEFEILCEKLSGFLQIYF